MKQICNVKIPHVCETKTIRFSTRLSIFQLYIQEVKVPEDSELLL